MCVCVCVCLCVCLCVCVCVCVCVLGASHPSADCSLTLSIRGGQWEVVLWLRHTCGADLGTNINTGFTETHI